MKALVAPSWTGRAIASSSSAAMGFTPRKSVRQRFTFISIVPPNGWEMYIATVSGPATGVSVTTRSFIALPSFQPAGIVHVIGTLGSALGTIDLTKPSKSAS